MNKSFKFPVVILANGSFPSNPLPLQQLESAGTVICTDGAVNSLAQLKLIPHVIIGDMDSIDPRYEFNGIKIQDKNPENSDLEKALDWVEMNDIKDVTLLGATGFREDMTLANLYILFDYYGKVSIKLITDHYTVTCHKGKQSFTSFPGEDVSLFTQEVSTLVSTTALRYQLENSAIDPPQKGISNQSMGSTFSVESSGPILVFRGHTQEN